MLSTSAGWMPDGLPAAAEKDGSSGRGSGLGVNVAVGMVNGVRVAVGDGPGVIVGVGVQTSAGQNVGVTVGVSVGVGTVDPSTTRLTLSRQIFAGSEGSSCSPLVQWGWPGG